MTLLRKAATSASKLPETLSLSLALLTMLVAAVATPRTALAWSEAGHVTIAEYAMRRLPEQERALLNVLAASVVSQDDAVTSRYGEASAVALTAPWLDKVRGREVKDIFQDFGNELPPALVRYGNRTTNDWHYDNRPWHEDRVVNGCSEAEGGQLNSVMPLLIQAFQEAGDPRDKAVVLAMLTHLVADAHQPLHTITRVSDNCQHDRGGNGFCVAYEGGRCELNLHQVWDRGFGVFKGGLGNSLRLIASAPAVENPGFHPDLWQGENLSYAEQVYPTSRAQIADAAYQREGRRVTLQRAKQAGERLAVLLGQLVKAVELDNRKPVE